MCKDMFLKIKYESKEIDEICGSIDKDFNNLLSIIDAFNGEIHKPINKDDLNAFQIGKWYWINKDVRIRKRKHRFKTYLNFDTEIKKGGGFGGHFHNDLIESTEVVKGVVRDLTDGKLYLEGDVMEYGKGIAHEPIAEEDTFLHVLFKP